MNDRRLRAIKGMGIKHRGHALFPRWVDFHRLANSNSAPQVKEEGSEWRCQ